LRVAAILGAVLILALMAVAPQYAMADIDKQDGQQGNLLVADGPGETAQPPPSSDDVQDRGLPRVAPGLGGRTIAPPTAIPFKCNAFFLTCDCFGTEDCKYMKRVLGDRCRFTDSNCTTNCRCLIDSGAQ
jgi:hypothetical protein